MNVGIIDYGAGNLQSVLNAFHHLGVSASLINRVDEIDNKSHLVLPGQGEFGDCASKLELSGLSDPIKQWIDSDKPFLGICVGYQLLFETSEESPSVKGLGIFNGKNVKFSPENDLKIPHIGWNAVTPKDDSNKLWSGLGSMPYFYYVHSYYPIADDTSIVAGITTYGNQKFHGAIRHGNLIATQFHPEKSQHDGLKLLKNFLTLSQ